MRYGHQVFLCTCTSQCSCRLRAIPIIAKFNRVVNKVTGYPQKLAYHDLIGLCPYPFWLKLAQAYRDTIQQPLLIFALSSICSPRSLSRFGWLSSWLDSITKTTPRPHYRSPCTKYAEGPQKPDVLCTTPENTSCWGRDTANPGTKNLDFRRFDSISSGVLILRGWKSQLHRKFPRHLESTILRLRILVCGLTGLRVDAGSDDSPAGKRGTAKGDPTMKSL